MKRLLYTIQVSEEPPFEVYSDAKWHSKPLLEMDEKHLNNTIVMILTSRYEGYNMRDTRLINGYTCKQWVYIFIARLKQKDEVSRIKKKEIEINDQLAIKNFNIKLIVKITYHNDIRTDSERQQSGTGAVGISGTIHKIVSGISNSGNPHKIVSTAKTAAT